MPIDIGIISHAVGAVSLILLLACYLKVWDKSKPSVAMLLAIVLTLVWCTFLIFHRFLPDSYFFLVLILEVVKNALWFLVLLNVLGLGRDTFTASNENPKTGIIAIAVFSLGVCFVLASSLLFLNLSGPGQTVLPSFGGNMVISAFLLLSIIGLALIEQVIRNTTERYKYHLKFLCLGLGLMYFFDLYMYSNALLFGRVDASFWNIRGFVQGFGFPLITISVFRIYRQPIQINVSRKLVLHSGVLFATGVYLLLMAFAGFYIRSISGEWGIVLQVLFWLIAAGILMAAIFSGRLRTFLKIYISRNLFSFRYDYREEWLRLSRSLAFTDGETDLPGRAIQAMADIIDSPGGSMWLTRDDQHFDQVAEVEMGWVESGSLTRESQLIRFLEKSSWILDLSDMDSAEIPKGIPVWLTAWKKAWLLVPLVLHEKLLGFVILRHSRIDMKLNWEDFDILKTAAQQTASYLAQMIASEALSTAQQFTAFNQMSAFVVHDIKTLNSQLSLMVSNAATHKTNPDFIEDMITTTEHAVQKMSFLLNHFRNESQTDESKVELINLVDLVSEVVGMQNKLMPVPDFTCNISEIPVRGDWFELKSAVGHLVKNAQEATADTGSVIVSLESNDSRVTIRIKDSGEGMTEEFIHTRLYRPFESTKGLTGMGIGVYQCREYVRKAGGEMKVKSTPGKGTEFVIILPSPGIQAAS